MTYLYVNNYIVYAVLIIASIQSTLLIHEIFKGHQIAIRRVIFHF